MGWLILSGAPGAAGYDRNLQLIRHNGSAGGATLLPWQDASSAAKITWAAPYAFIRHSRAVSGAAPIARASFTQWPPTLESTSFVEAGTPLMLDGVYKDGSAYRAFGGNFAGGATPYAITSNDGLTFFSRQLLSGANTASMVRGENGRLLFGETVQTGGLTKRFWRTDNYIDFTAVDIPLDGFSHRPVSQAGTSNGIWVFCFYISSPSQYLTYYSNDNLATFSSIVSPGLERVWAHGTTLYGAIGGRVYSSTNGATWTDRGLPFGSASIAVRDITYDGTSAFLLVGALGYAVTTTDFSTYTPLPGYDFAGHMLFGAIYVADATLYPEVVPPGSATIQGTLRLDTSDGPFAARKVYLYDYTTGTLVAETTSDGTTGVWQFAQVAPGEYFVVGAAQGDDLNIPRDFDAMGVITIL